jgi:hypothetical protein
MKEKFANVALFLATIIFTLLVLEITLRAYHGEWEYINFRYPQPNKFTGYHTYDAELGWVPKPERINIWGETVTILKGRIRSNGRDEKGWDSTDDATDDPILAVGDSYTFGDQVADTQTWPAQLEKLSGRRVINAGVDGYGVDQAFLRARRLLSRYRFSTVIFSFIPDDIRRSEMSVMFATPKPYFDFKNGQLTLENVPVPLTFNPEKESEPLILLEHSLLMNAVMKRLFPEWWLRTPSERQVQDQQSAIKVACVLLHKLEGITKSYGTELIVLAEHEEIEPASETREATRVLRCLSDPATRVVDLGPALSALKAKDPVKYHYLYNIHMSAQGNQFVARAILPGSDGK